MNIEKSIKINETLILIVIIICGAALRFYGLDFHSMWNDELNTWEIAKLGTLPEIYNFMTYNEVHPPGYHYILHYIINYFGDSVFVLKFLPAMFGVISIYGMFVLSKRLYSTETALIAASLIAFSRFTVYFSQEMRPYSMLLCCSIFAMFFYLKIYDYFKSGAKIPIKFIASYLLIGIITCYIHYFGLFFIFLQGVAALIYMIVKKRFSFMLFAAYALIVIAYIPLLPMIPHHMNYGPTYIKPGGIKFAVRYFIDLFGYYSLPTVQQALIPLIIPSLFFLIFTYKSIRNFINFKGLSGKLQSLVRKDAFLFLWILIPLILLTIMSYTSNPVLTSRNLIITLPALYLLFARSFFIIFANDKARKIFTGSYIAFLIIFLIFIDGYYTKPQKEQFKEATQYLYENSAKYGDFKIVGFMWRSQYFDYYSFKSGLNRRLNFNYGEAKDTTKIMESLSESPEKYFCYFAGHREPEPEFFDYLKKRYKLLDGKKFIGAEVWFFEK